MKKNTHWEYIPGRLWKMGYDREMEEMTIDPRVWVKRPKKRLNLKTLESLLKNTLK